MVRCQPSGRAVNVGRAIVIAVTAALAGCTGLEQPGGGAVRWSTGGLRIWAVPPETVVFPDSAPDLENEVYSRSEGGVRVAGAVGETVAFQLVLSGDSGHVVESIDVADLESADAVIEAEEVMLYRQHRVEVVDYPSWYLRLTPNLRRARSYPDVLVPLSAPRGGLPIRIEPSACESLWVDITIPPGARPGRYRSVIRLSGGLFSRDRELPIEVEVWPFALPNTRHLAVLAGLDTNRLISHHLRIGGRPYRPGRLSFEDPHYEQAREVLDRAVHLLHAHRCHAMLRDVQPLRKVDSDGKLALDWLDYDRLAGPILDGSAFEDRAAAAAWPMPVDEHRPDPDLYGGWDSPDYRAILGRYLHLCAEHFARQGWLDRHFIWLPTRGTEAQRARRFAQLAAVASEADPRLRLVCTLEPDAAEVVRRGEGDADEARETVTIWAPPARLADGSALAALRAQGDGTWLRPDRPPFSGSLAMVAPPSYVRVLAWQAYRLGCDGIFLPAGNDWSEDGQPSVATAEGSLVWPGTPFGLDGPVPSVRLKRLRRSVQDYEYLWLLERNKRPAVARRIARDLSRWAGVDARGDNARDGRGGGWVTEPAAWILARRLMAEELIAAMSGPPSQATPGALLDEPAELARLEQRVEWARFRQLVRERRVAVAGARIRPDAGDRTGSVVEIVATVTNFTADTLSGTLAIPELPPGWAPVEPFVPIQELDPTEMAERVLQVEAARVAPNVEGHQPFEVVLTGAGSDPVTAAGRLSFLTSLKVARSLTIDGKLDDWPLGAGNVAGDYMLVGAPAVPKRESQDLVRPTQATTAFVAHDARYLYIAFFCEDDEMAARHVPADNTVHYDELWPTRDDLVEVVLDPTATAGNPGGLFHVVVKANGAVITERGVPCLGNLAEHAPWGAGVVAAVDDRSHPNRWTVEIRIPWKALGPCGELFGINFARFLPRLGEYASWSTAERYIYAPVSLGTVRVAP